MRKLLGVLLLLFVLILLVSCGPGEPKPQPKYKLVLKKTSNINLSNLPDRPINILLLGTDSRSDRISGRADAIMVVRLDPKDKKMSMVSFPRDSLVNVPGHGRTKINAAFFFGGPELMIRTVENFGGITIDYFAATSFEAFIRIFKSLPPVEVTLDKRIKDSAAYIDLPSGRVTLTPHQALGFSRSRKAVANGDFGRAGNQQRLLAELHAQQRDSSLEFILQKIPQILANLETNVAITEAVTLAQIARNIPPENVKRDVLPGGTGSFNGASSVFLNEGAAGRIFSDFK